MRGASVRRSGVIMIVNFSGRMIALRKQIQDNLLLRRRLPKSDGRCFGHAGSKFLFTIRCNTHFIGNDNDLVPATILFYAGNFRSTHMFFILQEHYKDLSVSTSR